MPSFRRTARRLAFAALLALAPALAACSSDSTAGPRWNGSFTAAITTCGGVLTSLPLNPPLEAELESEGTFEVGRRVSVSVNGGCGFVGTIAADGSLRAALHPGCPATGLARSELFLRDVFATETTVAQTTVPADPQECAVEVSGLFVRD